MFEYDCPKCGAEVDIDPWDDCECPKCGHGCSWSDEYTEDLSDSWTAIEWDPIQGGL